jgi:predicted MFS family arabinose efflux permease
MTPGSQNTDGRDARPDPLAAAARRSILAGFLGLGLFMGMWGALVPARSTDLGLSELMIAGFLLLIGISLCAAIFMVTRFRPFQDPVRLIRYAGPAYAIGFALCLTTGSPPLFFLCGIFTGFAAGFVDTALNSQASQWEQATGRRAMSFFHALFSLGVLFGAGLVSYFMATEPGQACPGILACAVLYGGFMAGAARLGRHCGRGR